MHKDWSIYCTLADLSMEEREVGASVSFMPSGFNSLFYIHTLML